MASKKVLIGLAILVGLVLVAFIVKVLIKTLGRAGFGPKPYKNSLTFIVTVSPNTPPDDTIVFHYNLKKLPMSKVGNNQYKVMLDKSQFSEGEELTYGYSRGGFHPFGEKGMTNAEGSRQITIDAQTVIEDTVAEWKWLPSQPNEESDIPTAAGKKPVKTRKEFWKGVQFVDFWDSTFPNQYSSTINHLKANGYDWIAIAPPWDIKRQDPPEISNQAVKVPAYPDKELREHVRAFKKAGFKVLLQVQVCCEPVSFEARNEGWWHTWYDQFEQFVSYHAELAKQEGVDAIVIAYDKGLPSDPVSPSFSSARWKKIIEIAKSSGALIGYETLGWGASYEDVIPAPADLIDFWDKLDFMGVALWGDVVKGNNPTQEAFDTGMQTMISKLNKTYEKFKKPIVLVGVAYESRKGAGLEKSDQESFETWEDPEQAAPSYNATEQAMIYEALMRAIADRDYITGIFPFGYWYADAPLTVDSSIRAKMAERVLTSWFKSIP